jgi:predicted aldo/keto reductase-like oxidoreductase
MNEQEPASEPMVITPDLAQRIQEELGQNVYLCYQCVKCTSGCPVGEFFDWQPNQIMRAVQLGQEDIALESQCSWGRKISPWNHRRRGCAPPARPAPLAAHKTWISLGLWNS